VDSSAKPTKFSAPARVNLLGEHTDYTGGLVLPMAIQFATIASISSDEDARYSFESDLFEDIRTIPLDDRSEASGHWSDYPVGVLRELEKLGIHPPAFTLRIGGDIPLGSGLSSSASVEVASALAMLTFAGVQLLPQELATLCRRAENDYVDSPCGIMDQFVITAARAGHALLLDTRSLAYEHIPLNVGRLGSTRIVVCNSMVKHSIANGDYRVRRRDVESGQAVLQKVFPHLRDLGDATLDQLEACIARMPHEPFLRCRHIVTENARVREAKLAMFAGDPVRLGELMLVAHASQQYDFACSCAEIDFLVDTAAALPGCFGARMTGGGFGGCTVNLVDQDSTRSFTTALTEAYRHRFGLTAETYVCEAVDGALRRNGAEFSEMVVRA
jgi:galactokinase